MKSVTLGTLRKQLRRKVRNKNTPHHRRNLKLVSDCCAQWGESVAIYEDPQLRGYTAESISRRLGLSEVFVLDRLNTLHRVADYE